MKRILVVALTLFLLCGFSATAQEIRIAGFGGNDTAIVEELLDLFVRPALETEGINIVYEPIADDYQRYIVNALSAGTAPDLFYMDIFWAEAVVRTGSVEPLDSYLASSSVLKAEQIIPALLDAFTFDGQVYGVPKDFNTLAVFFNKDLFDYAGVDYPNENDTWDTFQEKLQVVADLDPDIYGLALQPEFARMGALAYAAGFEPFTADGRTDLSSPAFRDAFTWYTGLSTTDAGVMPADLGQGWGGGALATEQVAAALEGAWIIGALQSEAPNMEWGSTLIPMHPETKERGNLTFTVSWSMYKNSQNKEAAFKALELLTSKEAQQWVLERGLAIPSRIALADNPYFQLDTAEARANRDVFRGASDGNVLPFRFMHYGGEWMDPINYALQAVMSGQQSVDEALKDAQENLDALMNR